jgi:hypothetical protein
MRQSLLAFLTVVVVALCRVPSAEATVVFTGSQGGLSAQASFSISGTTLTVLLTNTDTSPSGSEWVPTEVLTGLFFNLGSGEFTPVSATIDSGKIVQKNNCNDGAPSCNTTDVGSEWSYAYGGVGFLSGENQGIASAGYLNDNTSDGNFGPGNLDGPEAINGMEFGIVPAEFVAGSGNGGMDGEAFIAGTVKYVLTIPTGLSESEISNVYFTYGTSPGGGLPGTPGTGTTTTSTSVPEPASLALLGMGVALAGYRRLRRSKA